EYAGGKPVSYRLLVQATRKGEGHILFPILVRESRAAFLTAVAGIHHCKIGSRWTGVCHRRSSSGLRWGNRGRARRLLLRGGNGSLQLPLRRGRYGDSSPIVAETGEQWHAAVHRNFCCAIALSVVRRRNDLAIKGQRLRTRRNKRLMRKDHPQLARLGSNHRVHGR